MGEDFVHETGSYGIRDLAVVVIVLDGLGKLTQVSVELGSRKHRFPGFFFVGKPSIKIFIESSSLGIFSHLGRKISQRRIHIVKML